MAGIYVHIPFCKQACHYCDFHFSTNTGTKREMAEALARELGLQRHYLGGEEIKTLYFGGGTPSLLSADELEIFFDALGKNFTLSAGAEVTLEANPDDLSERNLAVFRAAGINRLSIGIQSFDDAILRFLNRAHTGALAEQCVATARAAGFGNISLDLIYAIPGQPLDAWRRQIDRAVRLAPQHISSYSLTIEEKTAFGKWAEKGKLKPLSDEAAAEQLEALVAALGDVGYEQYEVSNFARPGFISRHNSSYWQQQKYLGVGPSAHSYNGTSRQFNVANNHGYLQALREGIVPFTREILTPEDQINDYLLTTLRTSWGTDLQALAQRHGYDLRTAHSAYIATLLSENLATLERDMLVLTKKGKLLADKIASDLFMLK